MSSQSISVTGAFSTVDKSFIAAANVTGNMNGNGNALTLTGTRNDTDWVIAGNTATYTNTPDHVLVSVLINATPAQSGALARISPVTEVLRNGVIIGTFSSYARHTTGHVRNDNSPDIIDANPGTNPVYSLRAQRGSAQLDVLPINFGRLVLKAVTPVSVRTN